MRISMEITMTDRSVLIWVHEVLGVGTLTPKKVKGKEKMHKVFEPIQMAVYI